MTAVPIDEAKSRGLTGAPSLIYLGVIDRCFLPCVHCHMWKHGDEELPTEAWERIIDALGQWWAGASLHFVGGEPLMRPDLDRLVARAVQQGFTTGICTNGWLVTPERARSLSESGLACAYISLDGIKAETVDATRGRAGSFDRAMRSIALFAALPSPRVVVSCILHANNATEIPELLAFARREGHLFMMQALAETLAVEVQDPQWWLRSPLWPSSPEEQDAVQHAIQILLEERARGGVVLNTPEQLEGASRYYRDPAQRLSMRCPAGETECAIDSQGWLRLCFYERELGSTLDPTPLEALWKSPEACEHRRKMASCDRACRLNTSNLAQIPLAGQVGAPR